MSAEGSLRRRAVLVVTAVAALVGQAGGPAFSSRADLRGHPKKSVPPATGPTVVSYTVRQGDSLISVARRLGVSVAALAAANAITDVNRVRIGQVLHLGREREPGPAATLPPPVAPLAPLPSPVVVVGGNSRQRVALGENLARIASRYGTTVAELAKANNIENPNLVREGAELVVPGASWACPVAGPRQFSDSWGAPRPGGRRHLGTDIFAQRGTPVVASLGGTLEHANGATAGLAYYLRGDDGTTYYGAHLETLEAAPGRLEQGARIGTVGSTGNAQGTTPHLHFEIHPGGGAPVNPMPSLERWCRT